MYIFFRLLDLVLKSEIIQSNSIPLFKDEKI